MSALNEICADIGPDDVLGPYSDLNRFSAMTVYVAATVVLADSLDGLHIELTLGTGRTWNE